MVVIKKSRRIFLKKLSWLGGVGLLASDPLVAAARSLFNEEDADSKSFTISILQTTDVHCQVYAHDELFWENDKAVYRKTGGYSHLATYFKKQKKKNSNTFIVDTGDMFQGSELSVKTTGEAMLPILNEMGYNLFLPGNWEVVYYKKAMEHLLGSLKSPTICANMFHDAGAGTKGELMFPPYYIWDIKGIKIGFIGYTDPLVPVRQSPNYSKGIIYSKAEVDVAYYADLLKNKENCAYVIVLSHLGLSQQISLSNLEVSKDVDYIFGGDTHERVRVPIQGKYTKVVEPGAFGSFVGKLDLTVKEGKIVKEAYELVELSSYNYPADERIEAIIIDKEKEFSDDIYKIAGYSTIPLYRYFVVENTIDTLILDALHWQLPDTDIILSNGFRFCPPRTTPDATGNIPITNGFIYDMLPVDSVVRVATVTGTQILEWIERELNNVFAKNASERIGGWVVKFKGMKISFYAYGEKGKRVKDITIGGLPVDINKNYKITACERDGDPFDTLCRIKGVSNPSNTPYRLHKVIKSYLAANSPVTPSPEGNATILDGPSTLLTQVYGVDYQFR